MKRLIAPLVAVTVIAIIAIIQLSIPHKEAISSARSAASTEADSAHKANKTDRDTIAQQDSKAQEVNKLVKGGLTLLGVGPAENPSPTNRGFIALRYCFINLDEDYVFIRLYDRHKKEEKILSGIIPGLSEQRSIRHLVKSMQDKDWPQPVGSHATDKSCEHDYVINFVAPGHKENNRTLFQHEVKGFSYTTLIDTLAGNPNLEVTGHTIEAEDGGPMMEGDSFIEKMEFPTTDNSILSGLTIPGKAY